MRNFGFLVLVVTVSAFSPACSCSDEEGSATGTDGGGGGGGEGGPGIDGGPIANELCPEGCQCSDGVDNDGDGQVDGLDAECTGPADDDEGTFATGIPGDNRDPVWQDCFFDGNSGAGDDDCRYKTDCITGALPPDHADCTVSEMCLMFCAPRTPNGCDCFGCCDVLGDDGMTRTVLLGEGCSLETVDDPSACTPCTKTTACDNECGTCELCPGREITDLPAECYPDDGGTPMYTCDMGTVCSSDAECPMDYYCQLGCCSPFLI